ncbi:hypothetical protein HYU11_05710 [Candidatus Woesearchaeota archaeon]|nr:hypothetical protein [Candidatus Woesearchaeota archaeon]
MRKSFFSAVELSHILRAWVAISLAFAILLNDGITMSPRFIFLFIMAAFTVGLGFLIHELSHKIAALKFGCKAEFRSFDLMLVLAVLMSFFGFVFAAPGAVFIEGRVNDVKNGIISAVGPLTNMFLAVIFFLTALSLRGGLVEQVGTYGAMINAWLAFFNMIPLINLDGAKILRWNKIIYAVMAFFAFLLLFLPYAARIGA